MDEFRALVAEGGVVFIGLDDKEQQLPEPRTDRKISGNAADQESRRQPGILEYPGEHRRRRGLAVSARHGQHPAVGKHLARQPFRARRIGNAALEHGLPPTGGVGVGLPDAAQLVVAVGVAVTKRLLQPGFLAEVEARGRYLARRLLELTAKHGLQGERGSGLLRALILSDERGPEIVRRALELAPEGLLLNSPRPNLLRFMPALNVSEAEIDRMIAALDGLLAG